MHSEKVEEIRAWCVKASSDLWAAGIDLAADPPLVGDALFPCLQAVEKALKGFFTAHDTPFRKTHDLDELAIACGRIDADLQREVDPAVELTTFAWAFRYPGDREEPSRKEAEESLGLARQVYEAVLRRLPAEVRA